MHLLFPEMLKKRKARAGIVSTFDVPKLGLAPVQALSSSPPLVSIITIVKNKAATLRRTILSVLNQSYSAIEYIVVDGASTDGSAEIIHEFKNRISTVLRHENSGIAHAFNNGVRAARGTIIGFLNADDWYEPSAVETAVHALSQPGLQISHSPLRFHDQCNHTICYEGTPRFLSYFNSINHPTVFARRECFEKIGLFRSDLEYSMDYEWFLRFRNSGGTFHSIPSPQANMATGGVCTTSIEAVAAENFYVRSLYGMNHGLNLFLFFFQTGQKAIRIPLEQLGLLPVLARIKSLCIRNSRALFP